MGFGKIEGDAALVAIEVEEEATLFGVRHELFGKGPRRRVLSPVGGSTLITSAPKSAIILAPKAAATPSPYSMTRTPDSIPGGWLRGTLARWFSS